MFAMHATANMDNAIVMVTMAETALDVDAESCSERIRYEDRSCVCEHICLYSL